MGRILQAGFALSIVLAASAALPKSKPEAWTLTICDVRSQAKKYLGKVVTVAGEVQRTGHGGVGMGSSECPSWGAALVESNKMGKSRTPNSEVFRDGKWKTLSCTDGRVFVVTVRGRFGTAVTRGIPIYRSVIDRVLRAEFIQQKSRYCINREPPVPPPAIEVPSKPMPDHSHK